MTIQVGQLVRLKSEVSGFYMEELFGKIGVCGMVEKEACLVYFPDVPYWGGETDPMVAISHFILCSDLESADAKV